MPGTILNSRETVGNRTEVHSPGSSTLGRDSRYMDERKKEENIFGGNFRQW